MAKNNLPTNGLNEISAEYAHETIKSLNDLYNLGRPENDDDVERRVDDYFKFCEQSSLRPGVESLALALSVSRILRDRTGVLYVPEQTASDLF